MSPRQALHDLVDTLPEDDIVSATKLLESLRARMSDPVLRALAAAPFDDEPLTDEERDAIDLARREMLRGETIRDEDLDAFLAEPK